MLKRAIGLVLISISITFSQQEIKIDSKVTAATVFKDRAMVKREANVNLPKGTNKIIISNLIANLKDETVRVNASGSGIVKILDVNVERRFTSEYQQEKMKVLQDKIDSLNAIIRVADDQIAVLNSKKNFVESLKAEALKYANERILMNTSSTKNWGEMLGFVENNLNEIYKGLRIQENKKTEIAKIISNIRLEMNSIGSGKSKDYKEIIINVDNEKAGNVVLDPSYIVDKAGWYPIYDARVATNSNKMELDYFGMIRQSTGEDWKDVKITLSTAEPLESKSIPTLNSWFLDTRPQYSNTSWARQQKSNSKYEITYENNNGLPSGKGVLKGYIIDNETREPLIGANVMVMGTSLGAATNIDGRFYLPSIPKGHYSIHVTFIGYEAANLQVEIGEKQETNIIVPLNAQNIVAQEVVVTAQKPDISAFAVNAQRVTNENTGEIHFTDVFTKELSTTFEVPAKSSIPSDNNPHKVTIAINKMPVTFEYTAIPKASPEVFLKGKIINTNEYPLLNGEINIFVDNDFINRTSLNTVVPTDTLELALGIDEKIKAEKVRINRFVESKGIFGGTKSITYDYEIRITNNKTTSDTLLVKDQIPKSTNEKILVNLVQPTKDEAVIKNDQTLEWKVNLKPGEKKVLPLKYIVEFPNDLNVYGLE